MEEAKGNSVCRAGALYVNWSRCSCSNASQATDKKKGCVGGHESAKGSHLLL